MFDFIHNNKSVQLVMKLLLGAIALSFVAFGAANYSSFGQDSNEVAQVGRTPILRQQVERELQQRNWGPDRAEEVTQELIQRQLLLEKANELGLAVTEEELKTAIASMEVFQKDGQFSVDLYQAFLQNNGLSAEEFQTLRQRDLLIQKLAQQLVDAGFVSKNVRERLAGFLSTQREVSHARVEASAFLDKVQVSDKEIDTYYTSHSAEFKLPEQVRLEYIVLSANALTDSQTVSDEEAKQFFDANRSRYEREERQSKHILFSFPDKADAQARLAVKAQAQKVLEAVRADPSQFSDLATRHSQDPGSAQQGGDLGWLSKEGLDSKFADALFKMQPNQISDLVESQFGYHIIQLNGVKKVGFEESKPLIVQALKEQKARKLMPELTERLSDLVADNDKNLAPVAQQLKLPLQTSSWITRNGTAGDPLLSQKDVLEKVFTPQSLAGSATDVIELPSQERAVFRVAQRQPARLQTLNEVAASIRSKLQQQAAAKLAAAEGQRRLAALNKGETMAVAWSPVETPSWQQPGHLSKDAAKLVFALPEKEQAQYAGLAEANGFTLFKVGKRLEAGADPMTLQRLEQAHVMGEADAFLKSLQSEIEVTRKATEAKSANE